MIPAATDEGATRTPGTPEVQSPHGGTEAPATGTVLF